MIRCPFCDHKNAPGATRCGSCGAELPVPDNEVPGGVPGETPLERQVLSAYQSQGIIPAIKLYREQTGVGLKDAKDAVEALAKRYGVTRGAGGGGCVGSLALAVVLGVASLVAALLARV